MPGGVHTIDLGIAVMHGSIFGKDCDAPFALQGIAVHHSFIHHFVCAERTALAQHLIHKCGLAVVYVRNDCDIS